MSNVNYLIYLFMHLFTLFFFFLFSPFSFKLCGWQVLGAPTWCQAWASEVGEPNLGYWTTRDPPAPSNINQQELSQWSLSQSSQTPQNTPPATGLPTRKTRSRPTHKNTGISPFHHSLKAYTSHWTNLTYWGQKPKTTGTTNLQPVKMRPQTH